jgi:hypothetical protein
MCRGFGLGFSRTAARDLRRPFFVESLAERAFTNTSPKGLSRQSTLNRGVRCPLHLAAFAASAMRKLLTGQGPAGAPSQVVPPSEIDTKIDEIAWIIEKHELL